MADPESAECISRWGCMALVPEEHCEPRAIDRRRYSASSMKCVVTMTATPFSTKLLMCVQNSRRVIGSTPDVGGPSNRSLPPLSKSTRSQASASSRYDVDQTTPTPSLFRPLTMRQSSRREMGSTPTEGSSSSRSRGFRMSAHARPSFCFMPPESFPAWRDEKRFRSVNESNSSKRGFRSATGNPRRSAYRRRFSTTLRSS